MNTGTKRILTGTALLLCLSAPVVAAPNYPLLEGIAPYLTASRDDRTFQEERELRKEKRQALRKERRDERSQDDDEDAFGYGYERRYPAQPVPRQDDRRRR